MDITISGLATVAGVAAATTAVVAILKPLTGLTGRATQWTAVVVGVLLMLLGQQVLPTHVQGAVVTVLNGILAGAAAIGLHQIGPGAKTEEK